MSARPWIPSDGHCFPDATQEVLLRAALADGDEARGAWTSWRREVDLDSVDAASFRILPLVARNLARLGVEDPWQDRLRGIVRRTWTRNRYLVHEASVVASRLAESGIPVLVLKGAAVAARYYRSLATRPMNDVDLLVPTAAGERARQLLHGLGWAATAPLPQTYLPYIHALGYRGAGGGEIDLHWHALWECCRPGDDESFWRHAEPLETFGFAALALDPTDQLLHLCAHGLRWGDPPPVYWVADAIVLLRAAGDRVDWERVADQAIGRRLTLPVGAALAYVAARFDVSVPATCLARLAAARAGLSARLEFGARRRPPSLARGAFLHWSDHARLSTGTPLLRRLAGFPLYLRAVWGVERLRDLPIEAARRTARRLVARRGTPPGPP